MQPLINFEGAPHARTSRSSRASSEKMESLRQTDSDVANLRLLMCLRDKSVGKLMRLFEDVYVTQSVAEATEPRPTLLLHSALMCSSNCADTGDVFDQMLMCTCAELEKHFVKTGILSAESYATARVAFEKVRSCALQRGQEESNDIREARRMLNSLCSLPDFDIFLMSPDIAFDDDSRASELRNTWTDAPENQVDP